MVYLFYTTYISVDLAYHEIVRAKVGKGGIIILIEATFAVAYFHYGGLSTLPS